MTDITRLPNVPSNPLHAADLAALIELEARWECLRGAPPRSPQVRSTTQELRDIQAAYTAFRGSLATFNKRHAPPYLPEAPLNTPARLGHWCQTVGDLYARVGAPNGRCPTALLEKAYRWADLIAQKMGIDRVPRSAAPADLPALLGELAAVGRWCDDRTRISTAA